jgi:hypothetical protein
MNMYSQKYLVPFLFTVFTLLIVCGYHFSSVQRVTYTVTLPDGKTFVQAWKHDNKRVFVYEEKDELSSSFSYGYDSGAYLESYYTENAQVHFRYLKSPTDAKVGEMLLGKSFVIENGQKSPTKEVISVKVIRHIDSKTICITTVDEGDGYVRVVTKLFDDKQSTYYLPDEVTDKVMFHGVLISTVHIVAKGRKFIPIDYVPKSMI